MKNIPYLLMFNLVSTVMVGNAPDLHVGEVGYVNINNIRPGQMRYSKLNVMLKMNEAQHGTKVVNGVLTLRYDDGKSAFPAQKAAPALKIKDENGNINYVLTDKHHDTLANIKFAQKTGVKNATMPIRVVKDFTDLSYHSFWDYAHKNYLVDLIGIDGKNYLNNPPQNFQDMQNDPVRYFITISARKIYNDNSIDDSFGAAFPLWLKILTDRSDPINHPGDTANERMIENVISQKLIDNDFSYDHKKDGESGPLFIKKVFQAHMILSREPTWVTKIGLRLIKKLGYFSEIKDELQQLATQPDPLLSNNHQNT